MTETLFQVKLGVQSINDMNTIPTLANPPLFIVPRNDCVEYTLAFLSVITNLQAIQLQHNSCINLHTNATQIIDLFHIKYPNFHFEERTLSFQNLYNTLLPGHATFVGLYRPGQIGHAVIFAKDIGGNIYLIDKQQNIKFLNADIYTYLNYLNVTTTTLGVIVRIGLNPKPKSIPGGRGKQKHTKHKSRKHKSRKYKKR